MRGERDKKNEKKEEGKNLLIACFSTERHQTALSLDISTWLMHAFLKRFFPLHAGSDGSPGTESQATNQCSWVGGVWIEGGREGKKGWMLNGWMSHFSVTSQVVSA